MNDKVKYYGLWALKILAALAFLAAGSAKFMSVEMMVATFDQLGFGQWFRYVTAIIEISGALLLFVPGKTFFGAALLVMTMAGAIFSHLFLIGGSPVPALVLLLITVIIAFATRDQLTQTLNKTGAG